jgi:transcriptional regulator with XRE-family HTH domain
VDLEQYRKSKSYSYRKLAEILGITGVSPESTVCRWCLKNRMPKPQNIKLILKKTNGKVKPQSFYE